MGEGNGWNSNGSTEMQVDFLIKAPSWIALDANISFGELDLSTLTNAEISMDYSGLTADAFEGTDNDLTIAFGSASIGTFGGGKIDNSYGEVSIATLNQFLNWITAMAKCAFRC